MPLVTDKSHIKKLKDNNINIITYYIVGNQILKRNTNNSINDDIKNGIRCKKEYYINNTLAHTEKSFDTRMEYSFVSSSNLNGEHKCPNCGMKGLVRDFLEGCPYCRTTYNIDYTDKELGNKYHYDQVLRNKTYRLITGIVDLVISIILSFIFITLTSRTFNSYDIAKIFIYGLILSLILYYFFYLLDAYVILSPIKRYKERENKKQKEFWERTKLNKKNFFNNLNYEIRKKYYSSPYIIDYDLIDYTEFKDFYKDNKLYIKVAVEIRKVYFKNNKITSKYEKDTFVLKRCEDGFIELKDGVNYVKCHNCGNSIDVTKEYCEYCRSDIKYLQEWILVPNEE